MAYKRLSALSPDPNMQGATQKVSAIRHFIALDCFFKKYEKDCDTRDSFDKNEFIKYVGFVSDVCLDLYTTNFYYPLKQHNGDYCVGSNFYSAGQVYASLVNPQKYMEYPKRGNQPLFKIRNGKLLRDISLYSNISAYLVNTSCTVALIVWLLRKTDIQLVEGKQPSYNMRKALSKMLTKDLLSILFQNEQAINEELSKYSLAFNDNPYSISDKDIEELFDINKKDFKTVANKYRPYITAMRTKPFLLLAGISGTGKSRLVRKLAQATTTIELQKRYDKAFDGKDFDEKRWNIHSPENFQLIQVKPNWHNSMDVVGYLSNIPTPHYVFTPFINFIVKAWRNPGVPFFLCLDEMNLAPVEEYFAEFLSAIESRSKKNGIYETDPIIKPFKEFGDVVAEQMIDDLFPDIKAHETDEKLLKLKTRLEKQGLTLPENLIVIGTVNMDETTFSFSRKVLDRAMSIEMNEVNYDDFLNSTTDDGLKAIVTENGGNLNELLTHRHIEADEVIDELGGTEDNSDAKFVVNYLKQINRLLEGTPFKLGYRAANEALIYLDSAKDFGNSDRTAALDDFTLMKILSRIEGDESKLKITSSESDKRKLEECGINADEASRYGDLTILTAMREIVKSNLGENAKSIVKIDLMITMLARDHFVSYWN